MNKFVGFLALSALLIVFSCKDSKVSAPVATTTNAGSLNIVFIDLDTLLEKYDLYQDKKEQLESQSKSAEEALGGKIEAFQKRAQKFQVEVMEIQQKANTIAPVELKKLEEKFGKQQENLAREEEALVKQRESLAIELEKKLLETQNEIQKTLDDYLAKVAKEKGYSYILKKGNLGGVMFGDPGLDITLETAEALNKEYEDSKK
jgi:outer membrane protein